GYAWRIDRVVGRAVLGIGTTDVEDVGRIHLRPLDRLDADGVVLGGIDLGEDRLHFGRLAFEVVAVARQLGVGSHLDADQLTGEGHFRHHRDVALVELRRGALARRVRQRQLGWTLAGRTR